MKVGDIVRQTNKLVKGDLQGNTKTLGVVIEIKDFPPDMKNSRNGDWMTMLGRGITVMWENGKITKNFAEHSLEVLSECG